MPIDDGPTNSIRVPGWFQGPTGSGQGGWTAAQLIGIAGQPSTIAFRAPIPLDTDLRVVSDRDHHAVVDMTGPEDVVVMEATSWDPDFPETEPVSLDVARIGRSRFARTNDDHPVPHCFSCGLQPDAMKVHPGELDDGRFATDWRAPAWAVNREAPPEEVVASGAIWAALDCTAALYACTHGGLRTAFTVQLAVEMLEPIRPDEHYALVGWSGHGAPEWDGRKRTAASAAFSEDGTCVARSTSFWVSVDG